MHLLSWHGTIMCLPDATGAITHQTLPLAADAPPPMEFDAGRLTEPGQFRHPDLGYLRVEAAAMPGSLHLSRDGRYICAETASRVLKFDRTDASGWETWLPVSAQDLADLQHILRHRWIVRTTRQVIRRNTIGFTDGFVLRIGRFQLALVNALSGAVTGRGGAGLPDRLSVPENGEEIELVIAEPRSSALLDTALWPVRGRRTAEIVTLAAHRFLTGVEPEQEVFERDTALVQANRGAAGLSDLLESLGAALQLGGAGTVTPAPGQEAPAPAAGQRDDVLMAWALRETTPWLTRAVQPSRLEFVFDELNSTETWAFLYRFADGDVSILPKPQSATPTVQEFERADCYLKLFKSVVPLLPEDFATTLCVCIADALGVDYGVPVFCFQKKLRDTTVLLPDIDFLLSDFHRSELYADRLSYEMKTPTAVFAGGTTGGTITPEIARNFGLPRLRAARFFASSDVVDFRLPSITQCSSQEAEAILKANRFCRLPWLTWQQQLQHRFILSMDGNGATCSRVAIALHSNSVLMKYNSEHQLFYFAGLQPWLHYLPVATDRTVEPIIALEATMPDAFRRIAEGGRAFARTFLTEEALQHYTAMVLHLYAQAISGENVKAAPTTVIRLAKSADIAEATVVLGHIQNRGDEESAIDSWLGDVGSRLAIEGFQIALAEGLPADGFFYQAVLADGTLSEPAQSEEYCGTRGDNQPVYGLCISTSGRFGESYEVRYEASFVDGSEVGPVSAGTICCSDTMVPLEAFRLSITARAPADLRHETV